MPSLILVYDLLIFYSYSLSRLLVHKIHTPRGYASPPAFKGFGTTRTIETLSPLLSFSRLMSCKIYITRIILLIVCFLFINHWPKRNSQIFSQSIFWVVNSQVHYILVNVFCNRIGFRVAL